MTRAIDELRLAARGRWLEILTEIIGPDSLTGKNLPCPGCGGRDRFQFNRKSEAGAFSCRAHPDGGGDGFDLIQHVLGCDFKAAAKRVSEALGLSPSSGEYRPITRPVATPEPARDWLREKDRAARWWNESGAITAADPAGQYLMRRGLHLPADDNALRFHPSLAYWQHGEQGQIEILGKFPAILARIQRPDGMACGLHRIYLTDSGRKFVSGDLPCKKLFAAGELSGGAVRLSKPTDDRLAIAEGIETAMAFHRLTGVATWAAISASLMPSVWIPDSVKRLYIAADADEAGHRAARKLAERLRLAGRQVWINTPPTGNDWNDDLLRRLAEAKGVKHAA